MRVIICGGRDYTNRKEAWDWFDHFPISHIIEGGAKGGDHLAQTYAKYRNIPFNTVNAEWNKYGKKAGYLRNKRMRDEYSPEAVLALPGGLEPK